jgi:4-phytase / acid phosphatase
MTTLQRATQGESATGSRPKLTLLVGHDTNLAAIGGVLGLHWSLPSYLPDETPPAGALHFELLREPQSGDYLVRVRYVAQTLDQMRLQRQLDRDNPPEAAVATIAGCRGDGGACPWDAFAALAAKGIDPECVPSAR